MKKLLTYFNYTIPGLDIYYHGKNRFKKISAQNVKNGKAECMKIWYKDTVSNTELNMFGNISNSLEIFYCKNFGTSEVMWPGKPRSLTISKSWFSKDFKLGCLQNLPGLKKLELCCHNKIEGNELKKLELNTLEELTISWCKNFNGNGLNGLSLKIFTVKLCPRFDYRSLQEIKTLRKVSVLLCFPDTTKTLKKLQNKGCEVNYKPAEISFE